MRVALVNDLRMAIEALRRCVLSMPDAEIAWIAEDGLQAVQRCREDRPDVILMDMIMPVMDGVEATRQIMQQCACPILVTTASVRGNVGKVYEALGHGAVDAVNTPVLGTGGSMEGAEELTRKISFVTRLGCRSTNDRDVAATAAHPAVRVLDSLPPMVVIGASTGGPEALRKVLAALPSPLPFALIVVQHLGEIFVPGLASWLANETGLSVSVVVPDQRPIVGGVHIACTSEHLVVDQTGNLTYVRQPEAHIHRPSVDVFFSSLLTAPVRPGTAILLTGMGGDGAKGLKSLHDVGWATIAQDEASSVVWGMPRAAMRLGAADEVLPVDEIGTAIMRNMKKDQR